MERKPSPEEVRAAVGRFWTAFAGKAKGVFQEMYLPDASVLSNTGLHAEPGRLAIARRLRKFFDSNTSFEAQLGEIEVQILGQKTALATYFYTFEAIETKADGSRIRRRTPFGRATHIFQKDDQGLLRIIHEHLSSATPPEIEILSEGKANYAHLH